MSHLRPPSKLLQRSSGPSASPIYTARFRCLRVPFHGGYLPELFGHQHFRFVKIRCSKHFPLQSSFLLCFVTTIVSISYFQSLICVSALSRCLYMPSNSVWGFDGCYENSLGALRPNHGKEEGSGGGGGGRGGRDGGGREGREKKYFY